MRVQHEIIEGLVNNMQRDLNFILGPVRNRFNPVPE